MTALPAALDRAVRVHTDGFTWLGARERPLPSRTWEALDGSVRRAFLRQSLAERIYSSFYVHGRPITASATPSSREPDARFVRSLSRALAEDHRWEPGWRVEGAEGSQLVVEKDGLRVLAPRVRVRDGALRRRAGSCGPSPGFWTTGSVAPLAGPLVRLYWHLRPEGAAALVRAMRGADFAWRLKVLHHPAAYVRCDAGVLYAEAARADESRTFALRIHRRLRSALRARTPPWTRRLAAGLAESTDPGDGASFGFARCLRVADGLLAAHDAGARTRQARQMHVAAAMTAE